MAKLNISRLEEIADLTFEDYKAAHMISNDVGKAYYRELARQAEAAGQINTKNYADRLDEIINNNSAKGALENEYTKHVAGDEGKDLSVGSDGWLKLQYERMLSDIQARKAELNASGDGELDYQQIINVNQAALDQLGLPPGSSLLTVPLSHLGEHDPAAAQARYEAYLEGNGLLDLLADSLYLAFGASVDGSQALGDVLADWADQAHWLNTMLDAYQGVLEGPYNIEIPDDMKGRLDTIKALLDLGGGELGQLAKWAKDVPSMGESVKGLPSLWLQDVLAPFHDGELALGSPLVIDLDGDGIELSALNGAGAVYFDIDNDGFREASGWVTGGDGLLALDKNGNGAIDNQAELFGNNAGSANGFTSLKALDSNGDNKITSADAQYASLRVWVDANSDGISQTGELYTLDVRTLFLPTLRGYGTLPDLHIAMSMDETLLQMVQALATAQPTGAFY